MTSAFLCKFMKTITKSAKKLIHLSYAMYYEDDFYTNPVLASTYMTNFL